MTYRTASPGDLGVFCALRQDAWKEHQRGGRRRSPDPVIARNHFTNVYRELDPGTVLARHMLVEADGPREALWLAVAYRLTNRREVWEAYRREDGRYPALLEEDRWVTYLETERALGRRVFTGRHLNVGLARYCQALQDVRHLEEKALAQMFEDAWGFSTEVRRLRGVGQFFAWQVTADLMMSGHLPADPHHVVLGPGAKLALRWIADRRPFADMFNAAGRRVVAAGNGHMSDLSARQAILDLRANQAAWLPPSFLPWGGRPLALVDLEHALCEYGRWGQLHARLARSLGEVPA